MPIYEYVCKSCGHEFEEMQRFSDAPLEQCPSCKEESSLQRKVSKSAFHLKGGGWYKDGYGSSKPDTSDESGTESKGSDGGNESKGSDGGNESKCSDGGTESKGSDGGNESKKSESSSESSSKESKPAESSKSGGSDSSSSSSSSKESAA
jgi:putative FmdB family regulatory protein